jgi:hypothetical protein
MSVIFEIIGEICTPTSKIPDIRRKLVKILTHYGMEGADGDFQFVGTVLKWPGQADKLIIDIIYHIIHNNTAKADAEPHPEGKGSVLTQKR